MRFQCTYVLCVFCTMRSACWACMCAGSGRYGYVTYYSFDLMCVCVRVWAGMHAYQRSLYDHHTKSLGTSLITCTVKPVYNDHSSDQAICGLCRQVVLVWRCFSTTEVNNEPAYSGLYGQVVFVCKWSLRQVTVPLYCIICIVSRCPLSQDELKELYSTHHAQLDSEMAAESENLKTKSKDSVQDTKEAKEEGKKVDVEKN